MSHDVWWFGFLDKMVNNVLTECVGWFLCGNDLLVVEKTWICSAISCPITRDEIWWMWTLDPSTLVYHPGGASPKSEKRLWSYWNGNNCHRGQLLLPPKKTSRMKHAQEMGKFDLPSFILTHAHLTRVSLMFPCEHHSAPEIASTHKTKHVIFNLQEQMDRWLSLEMEDPHTHAF